MPARNRTTANPSPADSIATLRERTLAIEAEWRELPQRRSEALPHGDRELILNLMIRERQLPLEWLDTLRQRVALLRTRLEAELNALTKEREELRQQLKPLYDELLASFERFNRLQVRYAELLLPDGSEQDLWFLTLSKHAYAAVQTEAQPIRRARNLLNALTDCELQLNRLHEGIVHGEQEVQRRVHAMLSGEPCSLIQTIEGIEQKLIGSSKG